MIDRNLAGRPTIDEAMLLVGNWLKKVRIADVEWIRKIESELDQFKYEFFKLFIKRKILDNPSRFVPIKKKKEYVCPLTYCLSR